MPQPFRGSSEGEYLLVKNFSNKTIVQEVFTATNNAGSEITWSIENLYKCETVKLHLQPNDNFLNDSNDVVLITRYKYFYDIDTIFQKIQYNKSSPGVEIRFDE